MFDFAKKFVAVRASALFASS